MSGGWVTPPPADSSPASLNQDHWFNQFYPTVGGALNSEDLHTTPGSGAVQIESGPNYQAGVLTYFLEHGVVSVDARTVSMPNVYPTTPYEFITFRGASTPLALHIEGTVVGACGSIWGASYLPDTPWAGDNERPVVVQMPSSAMYLDAFDVARCHYPSTTVLAAGSLAFQGGIVNCYTAANPPPGIDVVYPFTLDIPWASLPAAGRLSLCGTTKEVLNGTLPPPKTDIDPAQRFLNGTVDITTAYVVYQPPDYMTGTPPLRQRQRASGLAGTGGPPLRQIGGWHAAGADPPLRQRQNP